MNLDETQYLKLEEIYKMFSSATRLKILLKLKEEDCSAGDLATYVNISPSAISHQLKDLKNKRIVKSKKVGLSVIYSLDDNHIMKILENAISHILGDCCE